MNPNTEPREITKAELILEKLQSAQNEFWGLISDLEQELGIDIDSHIDFSGMRVDDVLDKFTGEDI